MKKFVKSNTQDIFGMARVGFVDSFEVYVNTNDAGNIPHFHIRDINDWHKFHTCIEIAKAKYFHHGEKTDILNSRQRRSLAEFMESPISNPKYGDKFSNVWELVCFLWEINNSQMPLPDDIEMPNYREIEL